jgi:hypothetical protein
VYRANPIGGRSNARAGVAIATRASATALSAARIASRRVVVVVVVVDRDRASHRATTARWIAGARRGVDAGVARCGAIDDARAMARERRRRSFARRGLPTTIDASIARDARATLARARSRDRATRAYVARRRGRRARVADARDAPRRRDGGR